jgi:hypothetical protein
VRITEVLKFWYSPYGSEDIPTKERKCIQGNNAEAVVLTSGSRHIHVL